MPTKSKKSTMPYNRGFEQHLTDYGVYPTYKSRKPDLEDIMAALGVPRPSLSPSKFSDGAFETYHVADAQAKDEEDVLHDVVPTIMGSNQQDHVYARKTKYTNLEPLTDGTIVDGAFV